MYYWISIWLGFHPVGTSQEFKLIHSFPVFSKFFFRFSFQLLCATVFLFPAWYLTSQPLDLTRMGLAWLTCALVTILAQTFGFVIGAACGMKVRSLITIWVQFHTNRFKQTAYYTLIHNFLSIYSQIHVIVNHAKHTNGALVYTC